MLNMNNLKSGKIQQVDDAYDVGIGTQFSAETNKRDEDEEMMKWVLWLWTIDFCSAMEFKLTKMST